MNNSYIEKPFLYHEKMQDIKYKCDICGRKMVIPYFVEKTLCDHCGHYVFKSKEDKEKYYQELDKKNFKKNLNKILKKGK